MASKRSLKLTLIIEEDFVAEALKEAAQDRDLTTTQMALEIIRDWYDGLFLEEDLRDHEESLAEYKKKEA